MSQLQLPTIIQVLTGDSSQLTAAYRQAAEAGRAFAGQARQIEDQLKSLSSVQSAGINVGFDQKALDGARAMVAAVRELEQIQSRRLAAPPAALQNEATLTKQITELGRERLRLEQQMRATLAGGSEPALLAAQERAWRQINMQVDELERKLRRLPDVTRAAGPGDRAGAARVMRLVGEEQEAARRAATLTPASQAALNNLRSLPRGAPLPVGSFVNPALNPPSGLPPVPVLTSAGGGGGGVSPATSFGLTSAAGFFGGHVSSMAFGAMIGGPAGLGIAGIVAGLSIAVKGVETAFHLVAAAAKFTFSTIASGTQAALGAISDLTVQAVKLGAEYEKTKIVFEVLTGGAEKGGKLFADVQKLALQTPFTTRGLAQEAQNLLGFGVGVENILPVLSRLGDVSLGDADRLQRLALAFGEVLAEGKLSGIRVRQFATVGVGVADFAKTMGVDTARFRDLLHTNQVGADVVVETINRLTSPGGRFFQMSQRGMETVLGQWTNLIEKLELLGGQIGSTLFKDFNIAGYVALLTEGIDKAAPGITAAARTFFEGVKVVAEEVFAVLSSGWAAAGRAYADVVSSLMGSQPTWEGFRALVRQLIDTFIELGAIVAHVMATIVSVTIDAMTLIATTVKETALLVGRLSAVLPVGGGAVRSAAFTIGGEAAIIEGRLKSPEVQGINKALQGLPGGVTDFIGNLQKGLGGARGLAGEPGAAKIGQFTFAGGLLSPNTEYNRQVMATMPGEVRGGPGPVLSGFRPDYHGMVAGGVIGSGFEGGPTAEAGGPFGLPRPFLLSGFGSSGLNEDFRLPRAARALPRGETEAPDLARTGPGPTDIGLKIGGAAGEAMARSMERNFNPGKINVPVAISPEARTLLSGVIEGEKKGLTPFGHFQFQQKLFDEILRGPRISTFPGFGGPEVPVFGGATAEQQRAVGLGRGEAFLKLQDSLKAFRPEDNLPHAALRGSAEAQDAINKGQYQQVDAMQDVLETLRLGKKLDEDRNKYLQDVIRALDEIGRGENLPAPAGVR
jgi:hypothetical protein